MFLDLFCCVDVREQNYATLYREHLMSVNQPTNVSYGLSQPLITNNPAPIVSKRDPTPTDYAQITTIWSNVTTSSVFILASVIANIATWVEVASGGGAGIFASLTVAPGPISLTGTTTINTAGAAGTQIGTGGTGAVSIGNATGGTTITGGTISETGTVNINTAGAGLTSIGVGGTGAVHIGNATGGTTISAGNLNVAAGGSVVVASGNFVTQTAGDGYVLSNAVAVLSGSGDPNGNATYAAALGSLYLNHTGSGVADRAFINSDGGTTWVAITTAS